MLLHLIFIYLNTQVIVSKSRTFILNNQVSQDIKYCYSGLQINRHRPNLNMHILEPL
ncbi:hypothetical protein Anacy_3732 [Anabaena cylindrica PCC 7122]|uniref:Uncharacterized protein n=1 Tax=Anabaena cylindrica (strain ATCC 27899 / PCC 7122) TaxID=272123 RepID=K9ZIT5_ANACC|nr:hypothetical protein Anacy_3732 [Anabaena cylindrica PCC 7122]BAY03859.1 hypothetical protein NIES19_31150 [Anabaena cylindrica PCC 7122]